MMLLLLATLLVTQVHGDPIPNGCAKGDHNCEPCPPGFSRRLNDTECIKCPKGSYTTIYNETGRIECTQCEAGHYQDEEWKSECKKCPANTFSNNKGATVCLFCQWNHGKTGATECKFPCKDGEEYKFGFNYTYACTPCPKGRYVILPYNDGCSRCPKGKFAAKEGSTNCTNCSIGTYAPETGSTSCYSCPENKEGGMVTCNKSCKAGYHVVKGQCEQCPLGYYGRNSECIKCADGTYANNTGSEECTKCGAGHYEDVTGSKECKKCGLGSFQDEEGKTSCKACQKGRYADERGSITCKNSGYGYRSELYSKSKKRVPCKKGEYQDKESDYSCHSCKEGHYSNKTGTRNCTPCAKGTSRYHFRGTQCDTCNEGYITDEPGRQSCKACNSGKYAISKTECKPCPAGTYTPSNYGYGYGKCYDCEAGSYSNKTGSDSCKPSPAGYYVNAESTTYISCPAGKYCKEGSKQPKSCPIGKYCPKQSANPVKCPNKKKTKITNAKSQTDCKPVECSAGEYYSANENACKQCPKGTHNKKEDHQEANCQLCPKDTYSSDKGATYCSSCRKNSYTLNHTSTSEDDCIGPKIELCFDGACESYSGSDGDPVNLSGTKSMEIKKGIFKLTYNGGNLLMNPLTAIAQSSTAYDAKGNRAVDGYTNGFFSDESCTHTKNETDNWWRATLSYNATINRVEIYNRLDKCCEERLHGAQVYVGEQKCGDNIKVNKGQSMYTVQCDSVVGDVITVKQENHPLTLCEVKAFRTTATVGICSKEDKFISRQQNGSIKVNSVYWTSNEAITMEFGTIQDFVWSYKDPIPGMNCVKITVDSSSNHWKDNYFCSRIDIGMKWSYNGIISNMTCTKIDEPSAGKTWKNKCYLCLPNTSQIDFEWSYQNTIYNKHCIQWNEPSDPEYWHDNYLCTSSTTGIVSLKSLSGKYLSAQPNSTLQWNSSNSSRELEKFTYNISSEDGVNKISLKSHFDKYLTVHDEEISVSHDSSYKFNLYTNLVNGSFVKLVRGKSVFTLHQYYWYPFKLLLDKEEIVGEGTKINENIKHIKYGENITFKPITENYFCSKKNNEFHGTLSVSQSGEPCINWNLTKERDVAKHNTRCQNPGGNADKPYCYIRTESEKLETENCDIPTCKF